MKRYEKYKDSGIDWIGEIPEGWEVKKFKYLFQIITDKIDTNLPKIGLENIESNTGKFIKSNSNFEGNGIHFKTGDILYGKLRPYLAKVYLSDFEGNAVGDFFVFRSKGELVSEYASKLILSKRFIEITNGSTFGSKMPRVAWDFIANLRIAYPQLSEQSTIANFLDRKTAEIDELIAQKEQLLELYEEEKDAIINEAVTKGLDPDVKLKDSGIDWLGEAPEGWEIKKLKYVTQILRGKFTHRPRNDKKLYNGQHPFIQTGDVTNSNKNITEYRQTLNEKGFSVSQKFPAGTLVMTIAANIGDVAILNFDACFPDSIVGFFPKPQVGIEFLYYKFIATKNILLGVSTQNTQQNLNIDRISPIEISFPHRSEQTSIVGHIETEIARIDAKIAKTKKIIALQKEYRTALISEAVTGKIKVTEEVES